LLYYKFTAGSLLKEFIKLFIIWPSSGGKYDYHKCSARRGTVLLKDEELA